MKIVICLIGILTSSAFGVRLKDIATIKGFRENQLVGYGMVVGLPGTGDRGGDFTENSLGQALKGMGVDTKSQKIVTKNSAAVIVSAMLPPFAKVGSKLDVTVASIASATSLEGGTLVMTPLKGADGNVYAVAQGRIIVAKAADRGTNNYIAMLSAQIPSGATLEKDLEIDFENLKQLRYQLHHPDFTTAARAAYRINEELGGKFATAVDAGTVDFIMPYSSDENPVEIVAKIESVDVEPDREAKVVVNRRTGTVVLGENVKIYPAAIAHNNLRIQIREDAREPQSAPPTAGVSAEVVTPIAPMKTTRQVNLTTKGTSIADIVTSLNEVGATSDDMVFLLQSLRSTGALIADLEIK